MARKRQETSIGGVMFTYVGSDQDFNKFLKAVVHDYLIIGDLSTNSDTKFIQKVESEVA